MNDVRELKIEIFGRVQGVTFRHFIKENADIFGVNGYVKNRDDGSVLIVGQGKESDLERLLRRVQRGPQFSKIQGVSFFWRVPENKYKDFVIALDKGIISDQRSSILNLGKNILNIKSKVPRHVSIIPDGNRRWAESNGMKPSEGHLKAGGYENLISLFKCAKDLGVEYLTLWGFSTENWKRSKVENEIIFNLISESLKKFEEDAREYEIRFRHLGRKDRLPKSLIEGLKKLEDVSRDYNKFNIQLCLDYGGRDEIIRAVNKILKTGVQEVKEDDLSNYLDSAGIPDPDLIIRTSGEKRISGFMSFQSAYSEFYFADVAFPEFGPEELKKAVEEFGARRRRFGK